MVSSIDTTINQTLRKSLDNFFCSLQEGGNALTSFLGSWSSFSTTVHSHRSALQEDTLVSVRNYASLVDNVSSNVLDLETESERLHQETVSDISKILSEEFERLAVHNEQGSERSNVAAYIEPSYQWLLANLHNPYPSKEVKNSISRQSQRTIKDIEAWFVDARKRIGWNKIRKTRFSNKQDKIIAAATHIFKPQVSTFTLDHDAHLIEELDEYDIFRSDFIAMEKKAQALYADKFPDLVSMTIPGRFSNADSKLAVKPNINVKNPVLSYPTPEPSPSNLSLDSPPSSLLSLPEIPQNVTRKRRQSSCDRILDDEENITARPSKRLRSEVISTNDDVAVATKSLLSNSLEPLDNAKDTISLESTQIMMNLPLLEVSKTSRKRRLSDADAQQGSAKRPHTAFSTPRLQTVSDPLPMGKPYLEGAFDGWLETSTEPEHQLSDAIPLPASAEDLISLAPLHVDYHQYDFSPYNPGLYLPDISENNHNANVGKISCVDEQDSFSAFESLSFPGALQNPGHYNLDLVDVQFDLIPAPSYHLDLQCNNFPHNAVEVFEGSDVLSLTPGYIPSTTTCDSDSYACLNVLDSAAPAMYTKTPVFGNFNYTVRQSAIRGTGEQEAKRARAQALREELALYEAEGL